MFIIYLPLIVLLIILLVLLIKLYIEYCIYLNSTYYRINRFSYLSVFLNKGRKGEYLTYKALKQYEKDGAKFLFNVFVPKENGETTEIDLILLTNKGIFVFESKNYSGWIFGNETQQNWCQVLPSGRNRSQRKHFFNPIIQNRYHIKHLKKYFELSLPLYSVIVFSNRCTLKEITVNSKEVYIVKRYDVKDMVRTIYNNSSACITESELDVLYNKLSAFNVIDEGIKIKHIENIHKHIEERKIKCPKCGGNLVVRTVKSSVDAGKQFYGCSNYPKCRYTKKKEAE